MKKRECILLFEQIIFMTGMFETAFSSLELLD